MRLNVGKLKRYDEHTAKRLAAVAVAANTFEVLAALIMVGIIMKLMYGLALESILVKSTSVLCLLIVIAGAATDVMTVLKSIENLRQEHILDASYAQLENLMREMRSQRHDFMNHIQVIYSLIEMEESEEALRYIDSIYGDMHRVSKKLRTDSPAVNALIQSKIVEAEHRGAELKVNIAAKWDDPNMPAWEICRVLANLLDNALDAATSAHLPEGEKPTVELVLGEDQHSWFFSVRNNGPAMEEKVQRKLFEPGFTTKRTGHGMGLYIVNQIVTDLGGKVSLESREGDTVFSAFVPRQHLQLPKPANENKILRENERTDKEK